MAIVDTAQLTAAEQKGARWATQQENVARAAKGQAAITVSQYLDATIKAACTGWQQDWINTYKTNVGTAFNSAAPATQLSIASTLGVTDPLTQVLN